MQAITARIQLAFNRAAIHYDQVTPVQKKIGEKLINGLPPKLFHHVIDLGCGTGFTTQRLASQIKFSKFEAIDMSEFMIMQANKHHSFSDIQFKTGSFGALSANYYDLVFSNMALHWSICFSTTLQHIHQALKLGGLVAFSIPLSRTFEEIASYCNIRDFYTADTVSNILHQKGFYLKNVQFHQEVLIFDNTLQALRTLKKTGATVCKTSLSSSYKQCRLVIKQDRVKQLSYHTGLFIAEKT